MDNKKTGMNPILPGFYPDPSICRVNDDYYLVTSTFAYFPGVPIFHSRDLVHWNQIGNILERKEQLPLVNAETSEGIFAPTLRYHDGTFYMITTNVTPTNDINNFIVTATDPAGPWSDPYPLDSAGIDPSLFFDDDGKCYYCGTQNRREGSRYFGDNEIYIQELDLNTMKLVGESYPAWHGALRGVEWPEGPHIYKKDGYYYIFLPAGGVATGWQVVLRSKNIYGPYESRTVLAQGNTPVNGPHQGGWVDTPTGEDWFMHFQDVGAYGRVVHLQPMKWIDGWPVIGTDKDNDGCGEPVLTYRKPDVGGTYPTCTPQESDEFDGYTLSPQWQWHANINDKWAYYAGDRSMVRLYSHPVTEDYKNLWDVPNLLLQKTPADNFTATMKLTFSPNPKYKGERTGLVVMGMDYAGLIMENTEQGLMLSQVTCRKADKGTAEKANGSISLNNPTVYLRVKFSADSEKVKKTNDLLVLCQFSYSLDGKKFRPLGETFQAREGKWIGAKVGMFCTRPAIRANDGGWADVDWFRITKK